MNTTPLSRRDFLHTIGLAGVFLGMTSCQQPSRQHQPNILWITCEDTSLNLGCYGDSFAHTPRLDALAAEGLRYENAFATAPVCAPARSCIISGMYATSLGSQHLRSAVELPAPIRLFPEYLREQGYYCTNNGKEDYNFPGDPAWDESSPYAHWRNREPGQPFFSVFNIHTTHQSQPVGSDPRFFAKYTSRISPEHRHDPAAVPVPPFYPDTPVIRETLARYYDLITIMDTEVGDLLDQLGADDLTEETIVFFYSDHGLGLPRYKRTLYDSGLHVPLIIRIPEKYQHLAAQSPGSPVEDLVSFVDLAPTMLSLTGIPIPDSLQGRAFLGPQRSDPRQYVYGASSRVDEAYEVSRSVRDQRYKYIRNYLPHLPYAQRSAWPGQGPVIQVWRRVDAAGELAGPPQLFMRDSKPVEELYDTQDDPYELRNLVDSREHASILQRLRKAHEDWLRETYDIGFLHESEMHLRAEREHLPPYALAQDPQLYPQQRIVEAARLVGRGVEAFPAMVQALTDAESGVRYWGAVALEALGSEAVQASEALQQALEDPSPAVRFTAAGTLCTLGQSRQAVPVLETGLQARHPTVVLYAARTLESIGAEACSVVPAMERTIARGVGGLYEMFIRWALQGAIENCR